MTFRNRNESILKLEALL